MLHHMRKALGNRILPTNKMSVKLWWRAGVLLCAAEVRCHGHQLSLPTSLVPELPAPAHFVPNMPGGQHPC